MASSANQISVLKTAHDQVSAIDRSARDQVFQAFAQWQLGGYTDATIRYKLEQIVRAAYRASAALGHASAVQNSGLEGWKPDAQVFNNDYLKSLISDVQRNLRDYKKAKDAASLRRASFRISMSASVAAQRGFTDSLIASYTELEDFGFHVRKYWRANFADNTPCAECRGLHGTDVGINEQFPLPTLRSVKPYRDDLLGPPLHPHCQCVCVFIIGTLENALEPVDLGKPTQAPLEMSTDQVKKLPAKVFSGVMAALSAAYKFVTGKK